MNRERKVTMWAAILVVLMLGLIFAVRRFDLGRVADLEAVAEALESPQTIEFDDVNGRRWLMARGPGEQAESFVSRCDQVYLGDARAAGEFCWESDCTFPPHVRICAGSQEDLDELVAAWCATHDCEECP